MYMVHGCQKAAFCVHLVYHAAVTSRFVIYAVLPLYVVESGCHFRSNRVGECRGSNNLRDAAGPAA